MRNSLICTILLAFVLTVSCGKRDHANPLDPASGEDTATATVSATPTFTSGPPADTPTFTETHTFIDSPTDTETWTPTDAYTHTNTYTETFTQTHTPTHTPTTVPWLDRGEVAADLPNTGDGLYYNESPGDPYFFAGMTGADVGKRGEWIFAPVATADSANIENYTADWANGAGSVRLFGNLTTGATWNWALYSCYITATQKLVAITKADGIEFWAKTLGANIDIAVSLETNLGIITTNGFVYPHVTATNVWTQHNLAFDTDFFGYAVTLNQGRWVRFGAVNDPAPKGAFSVLLDDIRFY